MLVLAGCRSNTNTQKPHTNTTVNTTEEAPLPLPPAAAKGGIPPWAMKENGQIIPRHKEHVKPATPPPSGLYVAMGDSITFGAGASQNCQAFPAHPVDIDAYCPDGTSYAVLVAKALRKNGIAGHFMNLGIGGAHVERVIADEIPYLPSSTTLVTLYIGTNDSRAVRFPKVTVSQVVNQFESHYDELLAMIHRKAPSARIVLINFPNEKYLAAAQHVPSSDLSLYNDTSQILAAFIDGHYPQYPVVDTICNPASYKPSLRSKGTVYPNDAGAAILANSIVKVMLAKTPPPPPKSCQWFNARTAAHLARNME